MGGASREAERHYPGNGADWLSVWCGWGCLYMGGRGLARPRPLSDPAPSAAHLPVPAGRGGPEGAARLPGGVEGGLQNGERRGWGGGFLWVRKNPDLGGLGGGGSGRGCVVGVSQGWEGILGVLGVFEGGGSWGRYPFNDTPPSPTERCTAKQRQRLRGLRAAGGGTGGTRGGGGVMGWGRGGGLYMGGYGV